MLKVKLCKNCAPLVTRAELDTQEKFTAKLCPLCKARVAFATNSEMSEAERRLLRKYGIGE